MKQKLNLEEKKAQEKDKRLYKTYGITLAQWNKMLFDQGGVCWICATLPRTGRLNVDHIHIKGFKKLKPEDKDKYVRGLLCFMCNTALKAFEKTIDGARNRRQLEGTYEYFRKFKLKGE